MTVKAEGLDVDQVAASRLTITAESPLRADSADGSTGQPGASLINTPTGTPLALPPGFMPLTGDMVMCAVAARGVAGATHRGRALVKREVAAISSWQPHRERGERRWQEMVLRHRQMMIDR